jgi:tetratricopeptide (TPR) repeat protein
MNRSNALLALSRFEEAVAGYDKAIGLKPELAQAFVNRGHAMFGLNRFDEAIGSYDRALAISPGEHDAYVNRGVALASLSRWADALASYDSALVIHPDNINTLCNRGLALNALGRFGDALASFDRIVAIEPNHALALGNRGFSLKNMDRFEEALASYDRAVAISPGLKDLLSNRAIVQVDLERFDEAIASCQQALTIDPSDVKARYNMGLVKLMTGQLEGGWVDYDARWQLDAMQSWRRHFHKPWWFGMADVRGKRLLLHPEQGFGDTIMFVRYVPLLVERGATVILEAQRALLPLLAQIEGLAAITPLGDPLPDFDVHCPLMGLPRAFGTTLDTIPRGAYLSVPASQMHIWRERLSAFPGPRVGLVWAGNPTHDNDRHRSTSLRELIPLIGGSAAKFFSLQKELRAGDAELLAANPGIIHLGNDLLTFEDTAAVVSNLDVVITVDTSVAHLAGALGKPVWIMLPYIPDWRWLLDREDSPWYPTARLFRQTTRDDWKGVVERLGSEMAVLARDHGGPGHPPGVGMSDGG